MGKMGCQQPAVCAGAAVAVPGPALQAPVVLNERADSLL
jgi:hypothetical protein